MGFFYVFQSRDHSSGIILSSNRRIPEDIAVHSIALDKHPDMEWSCIGSFKADSSCDFTHQMVEIILNFWYKGSGLWLAAKNIWKNGI